MSSNNIKEVQEKILEIMKLIDTICRKHSIEYYIMGGTALGAVRHKGFIPWDDDLDIFMTPDNYSKFKAIFVDTDNKDYVLQEWRVVDNYLEYAKVRMNGTTYIEDAFKERKDIHQGIYVDIMILHKVPNNIWIQKLVYFESKFVTLFALSQRNWKPKTIIQQIALNLLKIIPSKYIAHLFYKNIYKYDALKENYCYCYWITPAKFKNGLFDKSFFENSDDFPFEDTLLRGSTRIKDYLQYRYGDYMKLPSIEAQNSAVHAVYYDVSNDYREYLSRS